ncbi:MAG: hypothetical protein H0V64_08360 [Geodermatophilaceae bacterium]|nr:hypothetical protein [Geodermatophilaceae bacterium]MDQ3466291.1 hypothetical protein [Actinomycetota bacterium]
MSPGHPLFTAIVDDAALFPPGCASMPDALAAHPHHKAARYADVVGRFLCPASRLQELTDVLPEGDEIELSLIADTGLPGLAEALDLAHTDHRLAVEAVEVRPAEEADLMEAVQKVLEPLPPILAFVELPRSPGWTGGLEAIAAAGRGAKLRTGGTTADAFPSEAELAAFIMACAERDVPFKCTAGLHNAVRHRDSTTGFDHHGFLNVALATHAAVLGEGVNAVTALIGETDGERLLSAYRQVTDHDARRTRAMFVGFGSCSVLDPVNDLTELGLL